MSMSSYEQRPTGHDPREVESWALMRSARLMEEACRAESVDDLREALRRNQILWTIFQTDVAAPDSPLPVEIRQNVLTLSRFVDQATFARLADLDFSQVAILVDINRNLATGLMAKPGADAAESDDSAPMVETPSAAPVRGYGISIGA